MNAGIYFDDDVRNNVLRQSDNKQFNIYPKDYAEELIKELQNDTTRNC